MLSPRVGLTFVITGVTAILIVVTGAGPVLADSSTANYNFLLASGFLCDPNDSSTCPAVARASNGDTIEISGAGTLDSSRKFVTAAGAFSCKNSNGDIVETGIWTATELLSFKSYGIAPGTLMRQKQKFKASPLSPLGLGMLASPLPAGGLALLRIRLLPDAGRPKDAILQVNCALGKVPPNQSEDGVRLAIQEDGMKFDQKVSGQTVFILRRPGFGFPSKVSVAAADSDR